MNKMRHIKSEKTYFKVIFTLFKISLIFPWPTSSATFNTRRYKKYALVTFSAILLLFHALTTISSLISFPINAITISNTTTNLVTFILRFNLGKSMLGMQEIAKFMSNVNTRRTKWIYLWAVLSTFMHIPILILSIINENQTKELFFGLTFDPVLMSVTWVAYSTFSIVIMILPVNTFAIFYVLVCNQITSALKEFSKGSMADSRADFGKLFQSYTSIKTTVGFLDDELSFMVLCNTVFSAAMMYFCVSVALHPSLFKSYYQCLAITFLLLTTMVSFIAMAISASLVSEASAEVGANSQKLQENNRNSKLSQLRFFASAQTEIYMTVWKIMPIKRSFIVGTLGTIFTYVILFDSLKKQNY